MIIQTINLKLPIRLKQNFTSLQSLDVEWQPPPRNHQNGIITKYVIAYKESGARGSPSTLEVPGQILQKTINGLSKGKTYSITVYAATVIGNGPTSIPVTGTVLLQSTNGNSKMPAVTVCAQRLRNLLPQSWAKMVEANASLLLFLIAVFNNM